MNSLKTFIAITVFTAACETTAPVGPAAARLSHPAAFAASRSYQVTGDCSRATNFDPGTADTIGGILIQRGATFDCPLTGDIEGTAHIVLNLTLKNFGTPDVEGQVFGTTTLLVTTFFGRTGLSGTFEGSFNTSLADVRFGEARTSYHGTGDFEGLVLRGVAVQNPPGSGTEVENGTIVGNADPL